MNLPFLQFFCILFLLLLNDSQALDVNPGCLKRILGMNLSPVIKILFAFSFILV